LITKHILFLIIILIIPCTSSFAGNIVHTGKDSSDTPEKFYHLIKEYALGYNDVYQTPYFVLRGKTESPKMLVHGGMHGDEVAGYMACDTLIKNINLLEGTLIIIPKLNILACNQDRRYINIDLNHAFPGDISSDIYEYRLAYEMMWLVDSIKPDLVINLHEAMNKYDTEFQNDSMNAYGQIIITCIKPYESMLENALNGMNALIPRFDYNFHVHYYMYSEHSSMDNFITKFGIKSYTIETYRGFPVEDRVKLQVIAVLQFMKALGMKYEYPDVNFN
jgi:predicted deacylase